MSTTDTRAFPDRDPSKPAEQQGLFEKFRVQRLDGSDCGGGKHYGCRYFVLDMDHDAHAPAALRAYAASCSTTHPELSADLAREFGQAATEAAKATGTAGELPIGRVVPCDDYGSTIKWVKSMPKVGTDLYARPAAQNVVAGHLPELPESQADGDRTCDFHGRLFAYTSDDMREYGQACAEAARQPAPSRDEVEGAFVIKVEKMLCEALGRQWSAAGISIESLISELKSRQPAPVAIKTWKERMPLPFQRKCCTMNCSLPAGDVRTKQDLMADCQDCDWATVLGDDRLARDAEIVDLRAALAATAAPVLSDDLQMKLKACIETCRALEILSHQEADTLLAATRSQP